MGAHQQHFRCASCGAGLEWDPESAQLKCPACKTGLEIHPQGSVNEIPFEQARESKLTETAMEVKCSSCGAATQFEPGAVAGKCPFCAAAIVAQPKAADPMIAPHGVLPFKLPAESASAAVKAWLGSLWFAPNDLKAVAQQEGLQGVYIPFWTYDANTNSVYEGERGQYYVDQRGQRQIAWERCQGAVSCGFDDILAPATRAVQAARLDALEPWPLEQVKPYEPGYLAGFKAQRYQILMSDGFQYAQRKMAPVIEGLARDQMGGDQNRVTGVRTQYGDVTFKHVLLPVWIGAYRYGGKVYQVVVNAQRGEVSGERPVSTIKVMLAILVAIIVIWVWANAQR